MVHIKNGITHRTLVDKKLFIVKCYGNYKLRFYFPNAGLITGIKGFKNIRFQLHPCINWYSHYIIRFPFFYFEKSNFEWKLGLPNLYFRRIY
ncbi:hypothetical protein FDB55_13080 [Clostridium botulinum]|uniref:Uncharacterized protein n=1 Tax=Clostridium botulinum TaxID=1491 RepID=A0A6M0SSC0_CLOBO|nr:hypothetical protein [Clostridium botulinum]NFL43198.1 hypothetical protein [Clostridium botulinum]NFN14880.1 hypothetical protein [Clostridium botulinum]NFN22667.1 hypothetical protein [Clostridium botulinum]NFN43341.1 hypothetical protein [Clostridium botulinum]